MFSRSKDFPMSTNCCGIDNPKQTCVHTRVPMCSHRHTECVALSKQEPRNLLAARTQSGKRDKTIELVNTPTKSSV